MCKNVHLKLKLCPLLGDMEDTAHCRNNGPSIFFVCLFDMEIASQQVLFYAHAIKYASPSTT